jgi:hypothetical protein
VFNDIRGITDFQHFGPISLRSSENYLAAHNCAEEEVVNSYFQRVGRTFSIPNRPIISTTTMSKTAPNRTTRNIAWS